MTINCCFVETTQALVSQYILNQPNLYPHARSLWVRFVRTKKQACTAIFGVVVCEASFKQDDLLFICLRIIYRVLFCKSGVCSLAWEAANLHQGKDSCYKVIWMLRYIALDITTLSVCVHCHSLKCSLRQLPIVSNGIVRCVPVEKLPTSIYVSASASNFQAKSKIPILWHKGLSSSCILFFRHVKRLGSHPALWP